MATERARLPHEDRTADEPRDKDLHAVLIDEIEEVNNSIRLFKLRIKDGEKGVKFLPGQWLDVHIPHLPKAGGFTITSTPSSASPSPSTASSSPPYLELAIQKSPSNPPAAWLWQPTTLILNAELHVRFGGSFTYPPLTWTPERIKQIRNVVFVAGGVGINPLISMLSHMHETSSLPPKLSFLYTTKSTSIASSPKTETKTKKREEEPTESLEINPQKILFLPRLLRIADQYSPPGSPQIDLTLFLTGSTSTKISDPESMGWYVERRISEEDLLHALGEDLDVRRDTVVYVCGPPGMTDEMVAWFKRQEGVQEGCVFCEKWW